MKIIINIRDWIDADIATKLVYNVIQQWFVSWEDQYCYCTTFANQIKVHAKKTRWDTHSFVVYNSF